MYRHRILRHHVRPIDEVRYSPEAFRLALGEEPALRSVQAGQLGVRAWGDPARGFQHEPRGRFCDRKVQLPESVVARGELLAVQRGRLELELLGVENEGRARIGRPGIARTFETGADASVILEQLDVEIDGLDQKGGRRVVLESNWDGRGITHRWCFPAMPLEGG